MKGPHVLHPFLQGSVIKDLFKRAYNDPESTQSNDAFIFYMVCAIGALSFNRLGLHDTPAINYYMAAMPYEADGFKLQGIEQAQHVLLVLLYALQYEIGSMYCFLSALCGSGTNTFELEINGTWPGLQCEFALIVAFTKHPVFQGHQWRSKCDEGYFGQHMSAIDIVV